MPWYSALDSLDALLVGRQIGMMHLVCYLRDGDRVFETYWTTLRGVEAMDYSYALMDLTVYGRQEPWEDSPPGWPQQWQDGPARMRSTDAPSPSGHDSKLDALTTSPSGPDRRWRGELLNAEPSFRRLNGPPPDGCVGGADPAR